MSILNRTNPFVTAWFFSSNLNASKGFHSDKILRKNTVYGKLSAIVTKERSAIFVMQKSASYFYSLVPWNLAYSWLLRGQGLVFRRVHCAVGNRRHLSLSSYRHRRFQHTCQWPGWPARRPTGGTAVVTRPTSGRCAAHPQRWQHTRPHHHAFRRPTIQLHRRPTKRLVWSLSRRL